METIAKFSTPTEAAEALESLKSRGIAAAVWPDEVHGGMWKGDVHHQVGYRLEVASEDADRARDCLQQLGFIVPDDME